jgi:hypothetical protein
LEAQALSPRQENPRRLEKKENIDQAFTFEHVEKVAQGHRLELDTRLLLIPEKWSLEARG